MRWLDISFDFLPANLDKILTKAPNLLSLRLTKQWSRRDTASRPPNEGPKPGVITFPHLKETSIRGLPHSALCRISAPHLESLTVDTVRDLDFMTHLCSARLGSQPVDSGASRPMLKTFRMLSNPESPSKTFWRQFLSEQHLLEEIERINSSYIHTALATVYLAPCKHIRHVKLKWTFYPPTFRLLMQGRDVGEAFIDLLSSALTTILRRIHEPLEESDPGLRFTPRDTKHPNDLVSTHPRARILPWDQPWTNHPEWSPNAD